MCGICGIVTASAAASPDRDLLVRMRDTIAHRGPDDSGLHIEPGVGLGHRRLSIVDLAHGHQPMYTADRRYVVVYNGEIFNHPSIQKSLQQEGVQYRTRSDTESILHLFEKHGPRAVEHMRGMFAIALWDSRERTLFLARDRFGVKPLYYVLKGDGTLLFCSEIKGLLPALGPAALNRSVMPDFLANHSPSAEETLFAGVRRLPPGHTLIWKDGRVTLKRYWDLDCRGDAPAPTVGSTAEASMVEEFRERFTEAVRIRLMSDVPLGMFLSGGIDSAAITATMATLVKEPIRTFSVAFAEREANELHYARLVANAYKTEHREIIVSPEQFFEALPRLIWHEDEPLAHPSSVALYFVSHLASQHVKVVLTGEGSDEMLAGYNRYRFTLYNSALGARFERLAPGRVRRWVRSGLELLPRASRPRHLLSRTFLMRPAGIDDLYFDNFAVFDRASQGSLLSDVLRAEVAGIDPYQAYHDALSRVQGRPLLSQLLYADVSTYLQELLMKQDQMSMAASIESRVPFLDHPLAEWAGTLPLSMKLRGTTTKWILRAAMKGRLPDEILKRRKMGFPVPFGAWVRGAWRQLLGEYITGPRPRARGLFAPQALDRLVQEHLAGVNHSERLWALLTFEIWARIFLDGEAPDPIRLSHLRAA